MKTSLRRLWGVAAIPFLIPLVAPAPTVTPERDTQAVRIRVLAYNIKHGEGMDGQVNLERAARVIRSLNPDLVTLQEIDNQTTRTDGIDQAQ